VSDRKLLIGASRPFSAGKETKLKQNSLFACAKSYVASKTADSLPGSSANISFATSASMAGAAVFAPGAMPPNPIILKVVFIDHPSGRSSWTARYFPRKTEQVWPTDLMIFCIVPSLTKSSSRNRINGLNAREVVSES